MRHTFITVFFLYLLLFQTACDRQKTPGEAVPAPDGPAMFTLLSPQETNIQFQNTLSEGPNTNILMYEYFYNGGGVATGDFNGDGLMDVYLCGNMTENRLYLNTGGMKFKDITAVSGTSGRPGPWKTGVSIVDINGDGRLDIYLCYSGMLPDAKRANQLFINIENSENGIPHFVEQAEQYGLASTGYSNQAYFFDYDRDGDLDMVLLNHNPKSLPVLNEIQNAELIRKDDPQRGVRLFRQDKSKFADVTLAAGIRGSELTYGLGLGMADINRDGWPDFYISNDYAVPDYLYINNKNGTFTDLLGQSMGHISQFSMGNDVGDINNDGWPDILTLDMLPEDNRRQKLLMGADNYSKFDLNVRSGFHHQYMRNMLQLNNGNGTFSEVGQLAGVSNTDWSWAALLADYDNDGWKDLFITNGYLRDYTNMDFINFMDEYVKSKGRLDRENVLEIVKQLPASEVVNYIFANRGDLTFANKTAEWGMKRPSNSNGAAYADLDNDGDLDLVVNNINQPAFVWRNEARQQHAPHFLQVRLQGEGLNTLGIGATVRMYAQGQQQSIEQYTARGYLSAVSPVLHFGMGKVAQADSLEVVWPGGKRQLLRNVPADQVITLKEIDAVPGKTGTPRTASAYFRDIAAPLDYTHTPVQIRDFNRQNLLLSELSYAGPCMVAGDVNGDQREDLLIGGAAGQGISLFIQQAGGRFSRQPVSSFDADKSFQDADLALFDTNGDGFADLYAASGGYHQLEAQDPLLQDRLYLNDGKGNFSRSPDALPDVRGAKGCVAPGDFDGDGDTDVFVGCRVVPGRYPEAPRSFVLLNDGKGHFTDQTDSFAPQLRHIGMVTDALAVDLDQNGTPELALAGEWMPLSVFGLQAGKLENQTSTYFQQPYSGWWNTLAAADLNNDGKPDLIAGNLGLNAQVRASDQAPADLYFSDFDGNGSVDPFMCFYIQGKSYPYLTRDELGAQLPRMKAKYTNYSSYADAVLTDFLEKPALEKAGHWTANHLQTSIFLNQGGRRLSEQALPLQAQMSPVYAVAVLDANADGHPDLLLAGNNSRAKLRLGRFDACYGTLLLGDGKGAFRYVPQPASGLKLRGDVRSLVMLDGRCLFGINGGAMAACQLQGPAKKTGK